MKYLFIFIFLFTSCNTIRYKFVIYSDKQVMQSTWCNEIIETNNNVYMIKNYRNKIITNQIEWAYEIKPKEYKIFIERSIE